MHIPKHKPSILTRGGAREDLYGPGRWEGSRYVGWEGIEAAQARTTERPNEIARLLKNVRDRFYITGEHREDCNPSNTRKIIAKVRRLIGANTAEIVRYSKEVTELDELENRL